MSEHPPIVISIKHHTEPWIVFHAQNANHAKDLLGEAFTDADAVFRDGGDLVRGILAAQNQYRGRADKAVQYYSEKALHDAGAVQQEAPPAEPESQGYQSRYDSGGGNQSNGGYQQAAPAQQQRSYGTGAAAPSNAEHCKHGEMVFREGISKKTNRPYKAWMCPGPQGPDQCSPKFVR